MIQMIQMIQFWVLEIFHFCSPHQVHPAASRTTEDTSMLLHGLRVLPAARTVSAGPIRLQLAAFPQPRWYSQQPKPSTQPNTPRVTQRVGQRIGEQLNRGVAKGRELKHKIAQPVKKLIPEHENIYTVPNILTFTRLATAPVIGYFIVQEQVVYALALFTYSCITDFLDGYIARKYKMHSVVGSVIDPMADKLLMITCTSCLAQAAVIPLSVASLILGRDVLLGLSAIYYRYISLPAPKTLTRFWDFSIPSAEVHPTTISKYNTAFQMLYIGGGVLYPVLLNQIDPSYVALLETAYTGFGYFVGLTTVLSGLSYVFSKDAVRILTSTNK